MMVWALSIFAVTCFWIGGPETMAGRRAPTDHGIGVAAPAADPPLRRPLGQT